MVKLLCPIRSKVTGVTTIENNVFIDVAPPADSCKYHVAYQPHVEHDRIAQLLHYISVYETVKAHEDVCGCDLLVKTPESFSNQHMRLLNKH